MFFVVRADGICDDAYPFTSLQESEDGCLNSTFGAGADDDKLSGADFAQEPFDMRLIKWVDAALMQDDLPVLPKDVTGEIGFAVCGEADVIV